MKSISIILKNIRNLLPYLLLIAIYFFFVNLEAQKNIKNSNNSKDQNILLDNKSNIDSKKIKISIPVIPYNE